MALRGGERRVARLVRRRDLASVVAPLTLSAEATYLVTGGLGGLGLAMAEWLAAHGARQLMLVGRSEASPAALERVEALKLAGASVVVARCDVTNEVALSALIDDLRRSLPPLRGIVHAAGTFDDRLLREHDWERFEPVLAPKVQGGWNLHRLTRDLPLDFFVLFSSTASLLGPPGQGNYAAANAFLDALAHYRHGLGLPALSINWSAWSEVGAAAGREVGEQVAHWGAERIQPHQGLTVLEQLLGRTDIPSDGVPRGLGALRA